MTFILLPTFLMQVSKLRPNKEGGEKLIKLVRIMLSAQSERKTLWGRSRKAWIIKVSTQFFYEFLPVLIKFSFMISALSWILNRGLCWDSAVRSKYFFLLFLNLEVNNIYSERIAHDEWRETGPPSSISGHIRINSSKEYVLNSRWVDLNAVGTYF